MHVARAFLLRISTIVRRHSLYFRNSTRSYHKHSQLRGLAPCLHTQHRSIAPGMATPSDSHAGVFDFFGLPRELRDAIYDQETLSNTHRVALDDAIGGNVELVTIVPLTNLLLVSRRFSDEYADRRQHLQNARLDDMTGSLMKRSTSQREFKPHATWSCVLSSNAKEATESIMTARLEARQRRITAGYLASSVNFTNYAKSQSDCTSAGQ